MIRAIANSKIGLMTSLKKLKNKSKNLNFFSINPIPLRKIKSIQNESYKRFK